MSGTSCCDKNACVDFCPDVCKKICIKSEVQRGAVQTEVTATCNNGLATNPQTIPVTRHLFNFLFQITNCTKQVITNFRPRLDLRGAFVFESDGSLVDDFFNSNSGTVSCPEYEDASALLKSLRVLFVTASIGNVNEDYTGGLDTNTLLDDGDSLLLMYSINLPPGESHFSVGVAIDIPNASVSFAPPVTIDPDQVILTPAVFSFNGQIKCCYGTCLPVHDSVATCSECLPLEKTP